ncbi:MAG: queuosine precursor transporter [bacterium]|nr:queuosine precursor transporter [bacterium]
MANDTKLNILFGLFVGLLIGMNLLGGKIVELFGVSTSVAIFLVPFTFLITDIVSEVKGERVARQFLLSGVIALLMILIFTGLFVILAPHERYPFNEEYRTIFGASLRIMVASIIALVVSQFHDIWAFSFWKKKTQGRFLWLRNNASTMVSQAIDTLLFMFIAFWHVAPQFDALFILQLALPYYFLKILFAGLDTPLVYLGVKMLKERG